MRRITLKSDNVLLVVLIFALVLAVMYPLGLYGYVFTLDMVFTPTYDAPLHATSNYILQFLLHILSQVFSGDIMQKIILILIICLTIISSYTLSRSILGSIRAEDKLTRAVFSIFMVSVYLFNPFVYSRFITGQWLVLLGYALIPFFVIALIAFMNNLSWRKAIILTLWVFLISSISVHTLGLLVIIALPIIALYLRRNWKDWRWNKQLIVYSFYATSIFVIASSHWLVPALLGGGKTFETLSNFGPTDFTAFATNNDTLGVLGNVLTMRGFWGDSANLYLTPEDIYWWWAIPLGLLGVLIACGVYGGLKSMRGLTVAFICMFIVATILATGISGSIFAPINEWLLANIPFFKGYREPQKFVAIIVLVYAIFASLGVLQVVEWLRSHASMHRFAKVFGVVVLVLPIACVPLMPWGFNGQLKASDYPRDWYGMNDYFKHNVSRNAKVLALPWHMYMRFEFAERVIVNPMDRFFAPRLIMSGDPEFKNSSSYINTDEQQTIKRILDNSSEVDVVNRLEERGIHYILVAKEFDYQRYEYLKSQKSLNIIRDTESLLLYKIEPDSIE